MKKGLVTLIGVAGLATAASAQTAGTYQLIAADVPAPGGTTTVEVWASWDDPAAGFVFGGGNYDLTAGAGGSFTGVNVNVLNGPGSSTGVIGGNSATGAANGQLHIPPLGFFGSKDNPILLATYEWKGDAGFSGLVSLGTSNTNNFIVAENASGATTQLFPGEFRDGAGSFTVIPAPSGLALLGLGGLVAMRRRR